LSVSSLQVVQGVRGASMQAACGLIGQVHDFRRRAERHVRDRTRAKWASAARGASAGGTGWSASVLSRPSRGGGWR
jgi:hypothetical protein